MKLPVIKLSPTVRYVFPLSSHYLLSILSCKDSAYIIVTKSQIKFQIHNQITV